MPDQLAEMEMQRVPVREALLGMNADTENADEYVRLNGDVLYNHDRKEFWFGLVAGIVGERPRYVGWTHYFPEYKEWDQVTGSPDDVRVHGLRIVECSTEINVGVGLQL